MFIAIFLISSVWCCFLFGLLPCLLLVSMGSILCLLRSKSMAFIALGAAIVVVIQLETSLSHTLPREYQHSIQLLDICILEPVAEYEDYIAGVAGVVYQPKDLSLRFVRFSIAKPIGDLDLSPGFCLQGQFRLRQPLGRIIPGGFHADSYYFTEHIDAFAALQSVTQTASEITLSSALYNDRSPQFSSNSFGGVWAALALGWSRSLEPDIKSLLSENQVMHLFVVSGMHVGFILVMSLGIVRLTLRPFSRFIHLTFVSQAAIAGSILLAYLWLLEFPVPATRAAIMALLPLFIHLMRLNVPWWTGLAVASVVVSLWHPESWLTVGTWLSFTSVLFIILLFRWRLVSQHNWFSGFILFQVLMSAMLLPWSFAFGFALNPLSVVMNIIATPIIAFILLPISLLITVWPLDSLIQLFEWVVNWFIYLLSISSAFHVEPNWLPLAVVLYSVTILAAVVWFRRSIFMIQTCLVSSLVGVAIYLSDSKQPERVTIYDVGHGQSILFETAGERWLYDTGGQISPELSVFEFYLARTVGRLDGVIASHSDIDHSGGLEFILSDQPRAKAVSGQPDRHLMPTVADCHEVDSLTPSLRFIPIPQSLQTTDNDASCVLVYSHNNHRLIVTGDAGRHIEYYLLQNHPDLFPFDAVIVGHHGSKTSSAIDWLEANKSAAFFVSTSDRVRPQWPSQDFIDWFEQNSLDFWSTAKVGSLVIDFSANQLDIKTAVSAYRTRLLNLYAD